MTDLTQLAARTRMKEMPARGDQVFVLSDMEVDYAIARSTAEAGAGDSFRVERRSRGGAPVLMVSDTDRATAERYLAARLAADLRFAQALPALRSQGKGVAPGFALADDAGGTRLSWATGSAVFPATSYGRSEAEVFSYFATATLDEIIAGHGV